MHYIDQMDYQYDAPQQPIQSQQPMQQQPIQSQRPVQQQSPQQPQSEGSESKWLDLSKQISLVKLVLIPSPLFKGRLFGRGGETIKAMSQKYNCRLNVLGAGSTTDEAKERELLVAGEEKDMHFADPLHIKVGGFGGGY